MVFDFDGTLVDTMPLHYEAYRRTFAEAHLELTPEDFYGNIGGSARETIPRFLRGRSCARSVQELHARKKEIVAELFATAEVPRLATAMLLPLLHRRIKLALASSGSRPGIELLLTRLDWVRYFDVVVTGEDAARGKPAPDLFLLAARGLDLDPARCLAFEDTDDGVAAAEAAGMTVFDVRRAVAPGGSTPR
ncbi:MAG: HAD family phosphatase [Kofleriaceae bacterium]